MRKILMLCLLLFGLSTAVCAEELTQREAEILGVDQLEQGLSLEQRALTDTSARTAGGNFSERLWELVQGVLSGMGDGVRSALRLSGLLLGAALMCALAQALAPQSAAPWLRMAAAVCICGICAGSMSGMIALARQTIEELESYSKLLLSVLCSAAAASGASVTAGSVYAGSCLFFGVLISLIRSLLIPLVYLYIMLAAAQSAFAQPGLGRFSELADWAIRTGLKGVMYLFAGYLCITGILSGSADGAAAEAAKAALSAAVPVVGGILSDASGSIAAAASVLRASAGAFGALAILAILLAPLLRIALHYLALRVTCAAGAFLSPKEEGSLMKRLCTAMGFLFSMTLCCGVMLLMSVCCFMKAVNVG